MIYKNELKRKKSISISILINKCKKIANKKLYKKNYKKNCKKK